VKTDNFYRVLSSNNLYARCPVSSKQRSFQKGMHLAEFHLDGAMQLYKCPYAYAVINN